MSGRRATWHSRPPSRRSRVSTIGRRLWRWPLSVASGGREGPSRPACSGTTTSPAAGGPGKRSTAAPRRPAYHRGLHRSDDLPSQPDLPSHVQRIVDEIENEIGDEPNRPAATIEGIGTEIGEDPDREGLAGTPGRVHRMYTELTAGYHVDPERLINGAIFDIAYSEMVVVKEIPFYSLCEHHLLPFFGTAAVAYIPRGRVIGLSKIPRIVEMYARRLQVQERLTQQVADFRQDRLAPQGVGVVMEATHLCAVMRGVRKPGTIMTTSAVLGLFRSNDKTRAEFLSHLDRPAPTLP